MSIPATHSIYRRTTWSTRLLDLVWVSALVGIGIFLISPRGYGLFVSLTTSSPYLMAFIKFAVLATMGELCAVRIMTGSWDRPVGLFWRVMVWGLLGVLIALIFFLFASGVSSAMEAGRLPSISGEGIERLLFAFFTSLLMNLFFAPTFMAAHRITDTYIEMSNGSLNAMKQLRFSEVLSRIDWNGFITFVVCKTIPFFWIPAHTITFLLPSEQRVLVAAMLSIALGAILATAKKKNTSPG